MERRILKSDSEEVVVCKMYETNPALTRSSARKSRITDSFFEAKEKLEEIIESHKDEKLIPPFEGSSPGQTIITLSKDFINHTLGIEVRNFFDFYSLLWTTSIEICALAVIQRK